MTALRPATHSDMPALQSRIARSGIQSSERLSTPEPVAVLFRHVSVNNEAGYFAPSVGLSAFAGATHFATGRPLLLP